MKNDVLTTENQTEIDALKTRVSELEALVKYYEEQFRISKRRQFGASSEKSEYDFAQLSLFNEAELFADEAVPEPELVATDFAKPRTRLTRDDFSRATSSLLFGCETALRLGFLPIL
jgi:hypothetical protein